MKTSLHSPWPNLSQRTPAGARLLASLVLLVLMCGPAAAQSLTSNQQFKLDQVQVPLDNANKSLVRLKERDRVDQATLDLKSAVRTREQSAERLEAFLADNPDLASHPQVEEKRQTLASLDQAIADAKKIMAGGGPNQPSAGEQGNANALSQNILDLREQHSQIIGAIHGNSLVYSDSAEGANKALETLNQAEATAASITPAIGEFQQQFGNDRQSINQALDAAKVDVSSANYMVTSNFVQLREFLEKIEQSRRASGQAIADNVAARTKDIDDFAPNLQLKRMEEARQMLAIGQKIDPGNEQLSLLRTTVGQLASAKVKQRDASIARATWPGHVDSFDGPGSKEALASSVGDYLEADRDWGQSQKRPQKILAVAVRGPWQVADTDILGQPIQWRLPVLVAVTDAKLEPDEIAQAYELSMVAKPGPANNAPKSPPWEGFWVGDNFHLLMEKLP